MRYLEATPFSISTTRGTLDDVTYEIRVGLRCPFCYQKFTDAQVSGEFLKHVCKQDS